METITSSGTVLLYLQSWMQKAPELSVGFTTRKGGVNGESCHAFNLALHVEDEEAVVLHNRRQLMKEIGFTMDAFTCAQQVHANNVAIVDSSDRGKGSLSTQTAIADVDGLLTAQDDICLISFYADCVPLYFFEPTKRLIGLAHAGWRGTVKQIAKEMVHTMVEKMNANPKYIYAAIGPSIGACCYEVDNYVAQSVHNMLPRADVIKSHANNRYMLDLKECNRQIMIEAGILPEHIAMTQYCTGCDTTRFFSHRKESGKTGRMASWIGWQVR